MIKNTFRFLIYTLLYAIDSMVIALLRTFKKNDVPSSGILLIRLDAIGDFILWLDQAKHYREIFPHDEITLVGNDIWADLARSLPHWDHVIPVNRRQFSHNIIYRLKILRQINKGRYKNAISPALSREQLYGDTIIYAADAIKKIGPVGDLENAPYEFQKKISDKFYTKLIGHLPKENHELLRNASFLNTLSGKNFAPALPEIPLKLNRNPVFKLPGRYHVVFPGASAPFRQWSADNFRTVIRHLHSYSTVIICGGPSDKAIGDYLSHNLDPSKTFNLIGKTSLVDLCSIIKHADSIISNETCATHIAFATKTPSICIAGGGHYGRFIPYPDVLGEHHTRPKCVIYQMSCFGCGWRNPCSPAKKRAKRVPCIENIKVADVLKQIDGLLTEVTQQ